MLLLDANDDRGNIEVLYVDVVGRTHVITVKCNDVSKESALCIDGSSINVLPVELSDLCLSIDLGTVKTVGKTQVALSNVRSPLEALWSDTRSLMDKLSAYIEGLGYKALIGVELEFYVFKEVKVVVRPGRAILKVNSFEGVTIPRPYNMYGLRGSSEVRVFGQKLLELLSQAGLRIRVHHHEVSPNQLEVSLKPSSMKDAADSIVLTKYLAKSFAESLEYVATFMAKPIEDLSGSGMHLHISLWSNGRNVFSSDGGISEEAKYFIGGIIEHGRSLAALVSPTVNSYKRLVPGFEAPTVLAWGYRNRSAVVRVPYVNSMNDARIEFRAPDPTANPYIAIASALMAGLDGLKRKLEPGAPIDAELYKLSESSIRSMGLKNLPRSLSEALDSLEVDNEYLKPVFPRELIEKYIEVKRAEARALESRVSPSEFLLYMNW